MRRTKVALVLLALAVSARGEAQYARVRCDPAASAGGLLQRCVAGTHRLEKAATKAEAYGESAAPAPAWGSWADDIATTGWATIAVSTNGSYTSEDQMYSAGFFEGAASHTRIAQHFVNLNQMQLDGAPDDAYTRSLAFVIAQYDWTRQQIAANPSDPRWSVVSLTLQQLQGMADGYMSARDPASEQPLALIDFLWSQSANDDMAEVMSSLYPATAGNCWDSTFTQAMSITQRSSHCSALIKPLLSNRFEPAEQQRRTRATATYDDLIVAHNSWFDYRVMLRVFKSYHFALYDTPAQAPVPGQERVRPIGVYSVLFSSYPGYVWSQDDFYQISSASNTGAHGAHADGERSLYVMETTNTVCNASLFALVQPHSLFTWQRTLVANALAADGKDWTQWFAPFNSGTYNNQMMIVDFTRFKAGDRELRDGLFHIIEQMPGATYAADVTHLLRDAGYWASYNVPYFNETYVGLGYAKTAEVFGSQWTHEHCARANLFRRDHATVVDVDAMKALERSNHFQTDPLSHGNPFFAIAARGDLVPDSGGTPWVNRSAVGCVDAKVTDARGMREMRCHAIAGPTTDSQPPFVWDDSNPLWGNYSHWGQPTKFDFKWQRYELQP